jgi:hypothetical protein
MFGKRIQDAGGAFKRKSFRSDIFDGTCQDVASGKPHFGNAIWSCGVSDREAFDILQIVNRFDVVGALHWKDVFKKDHHIHFALYAQNLGRQKDEAGITHRVGKLDNLNNTTDDDNT